MIDPKRFTYASLPTRVLFDHRAADAVAAEVLRLGLRRVLIVHAPGERARAMAEPVAKAVASQVPGGVAVFDGA
ncbi:MAG: hypothetical protein K2Y05_00475, partial [Hyphomicrobiaceae bacterium]|nr:hypothetical protein [Hyphomicrobiaceae bacterium]